MSECLAKLLATENINVIKRSAKTASFNVRTRTLTIPVFKNHTVSEVVEHLFIEHEVGHALYTPLDLVVSIFGTTEEPKKENFKYKSAYNIVEDARIEKLMKRKYPGSKKDFHIGYLELREKDFFKLCGRDPSTMVFLDRANLFFKGFVDLYSSFSDVEIDLIERISVVEDSRDVFPLALEAYALSESQAATDTHKSGENSSDDEDDEVLVDENQEPSAESGEESINSDQSNDEEDDSITETDKNLSSSFSDLIDHDIDYKTVEIVNDLDDTDVVIPYKTVMEEFADVSSVSGSNAKIYMAQYATFKKKVTPAIQSMVKEFEQKKSATRFSNQTVSKTGSIDVKKLFSYKIRDDIFKSITIMKDSKNHGMVFLLDWSSSMTSIIHNTVKQLYILASFCRMCSIPFSVYAFISCEKVRKPVPINRITNLDADYMTNQSGKFCLSDMRNFILAEYFSHKMTEVEFDSMWCRLFCITINTNMINSFNNRTLHVLYGFKNPKVDRYSMGSTPLNSSMLYLHTKLLNIKQKWNVDKFALIVLTDGCSDSLCASNGLYAAIKDYKKVKNFMVSMISPVTKKEYTLSDKQGKFSLDDYRRNGNGIYPVSLESSSVVRMIRDTGINVVCINVVDKDQKSLTTAVHIATAADAKTDVDSLLDGITIKDTYYSKAFVIKDKDLTITDMSDSFDRVEVDEKTKPQAIAKKLTSSFNKSKSSYMLYNLFVEAIS